MKGSLLAFIIWLLPLFTYHLFYKKHYQIKRNPSTAVYIIAIFVTFLGGIIDIHFLQYLGLAIGLVNAQPFTIELIFWVILSLSWMPALGYFLKDLSIPFLMLIRWTLASVGAIWAFLLIKGKKEVNHENSKL